VRIYTKPKGALPGIFLKIFKIDYDAPVIVSRKFSKISDFCLKIHKNMLKDFRYALVWGQSVKYNP
jgi:ribosome-interacting GTPase 1